jgi:RNA polymerase sigma-70 factor, ECF subfamily
MSDLDEVVRALLAEGKTKDAATHIIRELGPEILGFLSGVLGDADADDVFAAWCLELWRSLEGFEGRCSIRSWSYRLARHQLGRFRKGMRRHEEGRVPISELQDVIAIVRTRTRTAAAIHKQQTLTALRDELPAEDRTLLILRVDRGLSWDEIALVFSESEDLSDEDRRREAARLRKRFQLIKQRLLRRAQEASIF